jgi:hypothetical protein
MLVDEKQARLIGPWGWDDFERTNKLARGTISMSRIGFDPERSEALLYAAYVCGSLCGHDMFVFLKREASGWIVVRLEGYGVF